MGWVHGGRRGVRLPLRREVLWDLSHVRRYCMDGFICSARAESGDNALPLSYQAKQLPFLYM